MRLPNLNWEWENEKNGWVMATHGKWKIKVSNMILCWWIAISYKGTIFEMISTQESNIDKALSEAASLFYFHYTEQSSLTKP